MDAKRRAELRAFLRIRRAAVAPESAGIPRGKRRLASGLRREEVALLADVGVTWYTWLEQGRRINVSAAMLRRVSRVLKLTESDEGYLLTLAGAAAARLPGRADLYDLSILQRVLDGFTTGPAVMFDQTFDVVASNALWKLIYTPQEYSGRFAQNHVYRLFLDPTRRALYVDYDVVTRQMVGLLRAQYGHHVGAREFEGLIEALRVDSASFARLWAEHETQPLAPSMLRLYVKPSSVTLHVSRFPVEGVPGLVIFFGPPADQESAAVLVSLHSGRRAESATRA
jgi:transcriptional regulator with XRE-family HTH domain